MDTEPPPAALVARARELWECLAGEAAGFAPALSVTVSRGSGLGPAGWAGLVVLDGAVLATAPDLDTARVIEQALGGLPAASLGGTGSTRQPAARRGGHRPGCAGLPGPLERAVLGVRGPLGTKKVPAGPVRVPADETQQPGLGVRVGRDLDPGAVLT